jgi:hypothetical protein
VSIVLSLFGRISCVGPERNLVRWAKPSAEPASRVKQATSG